MSIKRQIKVLNMSYNSTEKLKKIVEIILNNCYYCYRVKLFFK